MVARRIPNPKVAGSIPASPVDFKNPLGATVAKAPNQNLNLKFRGLYDAILTGGVFYFQVRMRTCRYSRMKTPSKELAADIPCTPSQASAIVEAHKLPMRLPRLILDRIAAIRAAKIIKAAGSVC